MSHPDPDPDPDRPVASFVDASLLLKADREIRALKRQVKELAAQHDALLAVCRAVITHDDTDYEGLSLREQIRQWDALVDLAIAAIAQAEGRPAP